MTAGSVRAPAISRRRAEPWWASRWAWAFLCAVAIGVLAFGSVHEPKSSTLARESRLDSIIKCPACDDLSIAQSAAPSAVDLRHRVDSFVREGWSDARIESWVTARFGSDSLLVPPTGGLTSALYIVPLGALALALCGLGWYFWRRRAPTGASP